MLAMEIFHVCIKHRSLNRPFHKRGESVEKSKGGYQLKNLHFCARLTGFQQDHGFVGTVKTREAPCKFSRHNKTKNGCGGDYLLCLGAFGDLGNGGDLENLGDMGDLGELRDMGDL